MSQGAPQPTDTASAGAADRHPTLSSAVRATSLVTLASRVGGLARDVLIGRIFGDGAINSAFQAAFQVPNMFRRLFGEGALSAAFIPRYTQARRTDERLAGQLASLTLVALATITSLITILAELALLLLLLLGQHTDERRLLLQLVMAMLPFMPLICAVAILAGMLQVHGRYAVAASGPLLLNILIIAIGLFAVFTRWQADVGIAFVLAAATVLSGATQFWWFWRLLRGRVAWTRLWSPARSEAVTVFRKFVPVAVGLGTLQLNTLLDTLLATFPIWFETRRKGIDFPLDESSNGILALTGRLYQFPLGVFGLAVASAAFPMLARHAHDGERFTDTLRRGLRLSLFIGLPATIGLILVRHDLTAVLFGSGEKSFSEDGLRRSAAVLLGFAPGVWAYSLNHVLTRAFYARGDTTTPMKVSIGCMIVNLALNLALIWRFGEAGMAAATSAAAIVQFLLLWRLARRDLCSAPIAEHAFNRGFLLIAAASLVMLAAVWTTGRTLKPFVAAGWAGQLTTLAVMSAAGLASYVLTARLLKVRELSWLLSRRGDR